MKERWKKGERTRERGERKGETEIDREMNGKGSKKAKWTTRKKKEEKERKRKTVWKFGRKEAWKLGS